MDELYNNIITFKDESIDQTQDLIDTIYAYGTLEGLQKTIDKSYADYFNGFVYTYENLYSNTNAYVDNLNKQTDKKVEGLKEWFTYNNPFNNFTKLE